MSDAQWFYGDGEERRGPFTAEQMAGLRQSGTVNDATLVWTAGMADWAPLRETVLNEAAAYAGAVAPPPFGAAGDIGEGQPVSGFGEAVSICFSKYVTFSGRANRPELWWFVLFIVLGSIGTSIVDAAIFRTEYGALNGLFGLAVLLPELAVMARRLHDTDRSGWWLLLSLIPIVGAIILIIWFCQRGTPGRNRFG